MNPLARGALDDFEGDAEGSGVLDEFAKDIAPKANTRGIAVTDSGWIPGLLELPLLPGLAGAGPITGLGAGS